ncbi:hypothetical protein [Methyloversatilis thermotolerans]|uniref:hypothetical protein n=1 Tax=Methyloversatilis thermotolerans TaxID=1346290 RepID=UPI00035D1F94|nr:hypothetical protein [Methyloversatilis thermotolerans]
MRCIKQTLFFILAAGCMSLAHAAPSCEPGVDPALDECALNPGGAEARERKWSYPYPELFGDVGSGTSLTVASSLLLLFAARARAR